MSWEAQGRNAAAQFDTVHAVVIAGPDPAAAASFALGVARVHGANRRVAIADLAGETAPLQSLITGDDPHGISDSFLYGVSLNKIARAVEGTGNVFLMPSGTEPVAIESVYRNDRWRRLAAGFQQVGALLLVVAIPDTPGFAELCSYIGAFFPIGDIAPVAPPGVAILAVPRPTPPRVERTAARALAAASEDTASKRRRLYVAIAALLAAALLIGTFWPGIVERLPAPLVSLLPGSMRATMPRVDSATARADSSVIPAANPVDSSGTARAPDSTAAAATTLDSAAGRPGLLHVANAGDSSRAALFSVYYVMASSRGGASPDARVRTLPAVAITLIIPPRETTPWYRVTVGASIDSAEANALLLRLRNAGLLGERSGSIVRVPYALRLQDGMAINQVTGALATYTKQGVDAYALLQSDGTASIYSGAYESPAQAALQAEALRAAGAKPVLVFRTGRAF